MPTYVNHHKNVTVMLWEGKRFSECSGLVTEASLSHTVVLSKRIIDHGMGKFFILCVKQKKKITNVTLEFFKTKIHVLLLKLH